MWFTVQLQRLGVVLYEAAFAVLVAVPKKLQSQRCVLGSGQRGQPHHLRAVLLDTPASPVANPKQVPEKTKRRERKITSAR